MAAFDDITPQWAWGGSTGKGVRVAVVDSGVDASHPALAGHVKGGVVVRQRGHGQGQLAGSVSYEPFDGTDGSGHGTACAGIIARLAPGAEIFSVKVLGDAGHGTEAVFLGGLRWCLEQGFPLVNMSLGTKNLNFFREFHTLLDRAYFQGTLLVAAASNEGDDSLPSILAPIVSVDYEHFADPDTILFRPKGAILFVGPGVMIEAPTPGGGMAHVTGTSFAAPHVTGHVARILAKHPGLRPFELKTILYRIALHKGEGA